MARDTSSKARLHRAATSVMFNETNSTHAWQVVDPCPSDAIVAICVIAGLVMVLVGVGACMQL